MLPIHCSNNLIYTMIPYQKEKIENAICFFAGEHRKKTGHPLHQTFLYKYLAFLDFESLRETGRPCLGLSYQAMEHGPVPMKIYNERAKITSSLFEFIRNQDDTYTIHPKAKPNLDYFSKKEISQMQRLIEIYATNYIPAKLISDATHERITAWKKTWKSQPNGMIDYKSEFDDDPLNKKTEDLTYSEESYLIYRAMET